MKNLIIGAATGYTWDILEPWVRSIRLSGYQDDVVVTTRYMPRMEPKTIEMLNEYGVRVHSIDMKQHCAPHVERFLHIAAFLRQTKENYGYVISTDTRDVIFQENPVPFLQQNIIKNTLISAPENLLYEDEPWGKQNYLDTFGQYFFDFIKDKQILNVGVIAGQFVAVRDLMENIFLMSINRSISICDQAVYNFLMNSEAYQNTTWNSEGSKWAIQLGTTVAAIQAGKGDIASVNIGEFLKKTLDAEPVIRDGLVYSATGEKYIIVHQYDRIAEKEEIRGHYVRG